MTTKNEYPYALEMFGLESKVRGLYLTVACDFEKTMTEIISMCEEPDVDKRSSLELKLRYEMGKKLERCKAAVINYNIVYYNHFIPQFEVIESLLKYRNMLAHGFSYYDDKKTDKKYISFSWSEKGKLKTDTIEVMPFVKSIEEYRKHIWLFYTLHAKIAEEVG